MNFKFFRNKEKEQAIANSDLTSEEVKKDKKVKVEIVKIYLSGFKEYEFFAPYSEDNLIKLDRAIANGSGQDFVELADFNDGIMVVRISSIVTYFKDTMKIRLTDEDKIKYDSLIVNQS